MNPFAPLLAVICLPIIAIGLLLYTDAGIEPSLFYDSVKTFIILAVVAVAMSVAVTKLAERTKA